MITALDRYVARVFLRAWVVSLVFFLGLFGVIEFFGDLDDLIGTMEEHEVSPKHLAQFYLYSLPTIMTEIAPFVMLTASVIAIGRLKRHNEFMAMVLTGRSSLRVAAPVLVLVVVFIGLIVVVQERVTPRVAVVRLELEAQLFHGGELVIDEVPMRDSRSRQLVARNYHVEEERIGKLNVSYWHDAKRHVHIEGVDAVFDEEGGGWRLKGGTSEMVQGTETIVEDVAFVPTDIRPEDLLLDHLDEFDLSYAEILDRSARYPGKPAYRLRKHYHVTYPLSILLLVLLGLPFALKDDHTSRWRGPMLSFCLCLGFLILDRVMHDLGTSGAINPVMAAWIPPVVAGSLAFVLLDTVEE